jgi:hypothetical protein
MKALLRALAHSAAAIIIGGAALTAGCTAPTSSDNGVAAPCGPVASANRELDYLGKGHEFTVTGTVQSVLPGDDSSPAAGLVLGQVKVEQHEGKAAAWFQAHPAPTTLYSQSGDGTSLVETFQNDPEHTQVTVTDMVDKRVRITGAIAEKKGTCGEILVFALMFKVQQL